MSIYVGDKKAKLYQGDYGPAQFYKGDVKIAGYTDVEKVGAAISGVDTYNDALLPTIGGKSEQTVTVLGKNLVDSLAYPRRDIDFKIAISAGDYIQTTFNGNDLSTGGIILGTTYSSRFLDANKATVLSQIQSGVHVTEEQAKIITTLRVNWTDAYYTGTSPTIVSQLEVGKTRTPYEPFVPNSPSPDYPAPIRSSANFDVVSCGRNLMGQERWYKYLRGINPSNVAIKSDLSHADYISMYCPAYPSNSRFMRGEFLERTQYTFSYWYKLETSLQEGIPYHTGIRIQYTDGTNSYWLVDYAHKTTQWVYVTFVSNAGKTIDYLYFLNSGNYSPWSGFADFQIEEGTVATPYQPYHATPAHVTDPLRSVGDVADSIEVSEGVEVVRRVAVVKLTGSADVYWFQYPSSYGQKYCCMSTGDLTGKRIGTVICTHDTGQASSAVIGGNALGIWPNNNPIYNNFMYWGIEYSLIGTNPTSTAEENEAAFRAWLSAQATAGTPVTVQYQLATPTRTDITATPLGQALLAMRTYPHYTQVYTNATLPPTLRARIKEMDKSGSVDM